MKDKWEDGFRENDLRVRKTTRSLYDAMFALLSRYNFNHITVNSLCLEALVSRATFYAHFCDKYDLLRYLLSEVKDGIVKDACNYDELEKSINQFIGSNKRLITNILKDANSETLALIREFIASIVELTIKREIINKTSPEYIILLNFFIGGLANVVIWVTENNFPQEVPVMSTYLYNMVEVITTWDAEYERTENATRN